MPELSLAIPILPLRARVGVLLERFTKVIEFARMRGTCASDLKMTVISISAIGRNRFPLAFFSFEPPKWQSVFVQISDAVVAEPFLSRPIAVRVACDIE